METSEKKATILEKAFQWNVRTTDLSPLLGWCGELDAVFWAVAVTLLALVSGVFKREMRNITTACARNELCSLQRTLL